MITEIKFYSDSIEVSGSMGTKQFEYDTDLSESMTDKDRVCIDGDYIIYRRWDFGDYLKLNVITGEVVELPQPQFVNTSKRVDVVVDSSCWGITFLYEEQMNDFNRVIDYLNRVSKEDGYDDLFIGLLRRLNINVEKDTPGYSALRRIEMHISRYVMYQIIYDTACDILGVESIDLFSEWLEDGRRY